MLQDAVDSANVSVRLSELPTSSRALVRVFEIFSPAVFDGCKEPPCIILNKCMYYNVWLIINTVTIRIHHSVCDEEIFVEHVHQETVCMDMPVHSITTLVRICMYVCMYVVFTH